MTKVYSMRIAFNGTSDGLRTKLSHRYPPGMAVRWATDLLALVASVGARR
jgi:hypothetical protein